MIFKDRHEAGKRLVAKLENYKNKKQTIVLGLARGGVPVAYEMSQLLRLPLNVLVPRKIGAPYNPELAIGAIVEAGEGIFNDEIIRILDVPSEYIEKEVAKQRELARQRVKLYRYNAPLGDLTDQTVILVDDGIATGATMFAAVRAMRDQGAMKVVVAVPVAASDTLTLLEAVADEVVCVHSSDQLGAIGYFYHEFAQTADEEVIKLLEEANK